MRSCVRSGSSVCLAYAACHFVVDLACISTLMGLVVPLADGWDAALSVPLILAYDMLAFCLQLPIGAALDVLGRRWSRHATLLSLALVAAGVTLACLREPAFGVAAVVCIAFGNALFHAVGGIEVLGESNGRMAPSGEFISTGALGVFVGGLAGFNGWPRTPLLLLALLGICAVLVLVVATGPAQEVAAFSLPPARSCLPAVVLLALTVALRSYVGMVMAFPWKADVVLAGAVVVGVAVGKAAGGRIADAIGTPMASAISLGGAALLFLPSWEYAPAGLVAAVLFNFTMAITLGSLADVLPRARGMAFGIASFSLAMGALPALLGLRVESGAALCVLSLVSLVLLELGLMAMPRGAEPSTELDSGRPALGARLPDGRQ